MQRLVEVLQEKTGRVVSAAPPGPRGGPEAPSDLTLQHGGVQPPLPALQAAAGLRPAVIGRAQRVLQPGLLGAAPPQQAAAAQVDGDHQTFVAGEAFLHLLHRSESEKAEKSRRRLTPNLQLPDVGFEVPDAGGRREALQPLQLRQHPAQPGSDVAQVRV